MLTTFQPSSLRRALRFGAVACFLALANLLPLAGADQAQQPEGASPKGSAGALPRVFEKPAPESLEDLQAIQAHVARIIKKVMPAVVNVKAGAQGSGVVVTEDGYVLTAGHVSGKSGRDVTLTFFDGRSVKGKTLGANNGIDSGLIKITEDGKYPFAEMGRSGELKRGEWCMAIGHAGGLKKDRTPPVRLGRVLDNSPALVRSDCTLVGGDSGGPLFDMQGRVIGIHSRIGQSLNSNIHVPVDTFRDTWERLAKGEVWGSKGKGKDGKGKGKGKDEQPKGDPWMGVTEDPDAKDCRIGDVTPNSPAAKAGLKVGDVVLSFGGTKIETFADLVNQVSRSRPGQEVDLEVRRDGQTMTLRLVVGTRPKL